GMGLFRRDRGRKGAEGLAFFDHSVDSIAHLRMTWIGEDTPVSQGTWAELHSPAMPGDDAAASYPIGSFGARQLRARKFFDLDEGCVLCERCRDFGFCACRAEEGYRQPAITDAIMPCCPLQGGPQCGSIVPGSRLDIELVEVP